MPPNRAFWAIVVPWTVAAVGGVCGIALAQPPTFDPRINPPSLSAPAPADRTGVDFDATVYRALRANPRSLSPIFRSSSYEFYLAELLFPTLVVWDADMNWMTHPDLVESYRESDDHTQATIRLRDGLTWHDGTPFTAHDVAFSWEVILDPRVPVPAMRVGTDQIAECRALDSRTVVFVHRSSGPVTRANLAFSIIPRHIYQPRRDDDPTLRDSENFTTLFSPPATHNALFFLTES